ncbi:hypothetical protein [Pseudomonas urmiensis]|uniref:hypothetical protein n=1 Tax=Pseudomonas urmiensis TaxID=2745493 RepID=UPI003D0EBB43
MTKNDFLTNADTLAFLAWFESVVIGARPLQFRHRAGVDDLLSNAFERYSWPLKRIELATPAGAISIARNSNFAQNEALLHKLSDGIKGCMAQHTVNAAELTGWAKAIMEWGGVFKRPGNAVWLENLNGGLHEYLTRALPALENEEPHLLERLNDLRSNAGTTKIHSLILPGFVIYDSRVAAAFAWLAGEWARECGLRVPEHLCFGCMRANSQKTPRAVRTPDSKTFKYFTPSGHIRYHRRHATWNRRANWIIERLAKAATLDCSGARLPRTWTSREIEAALFMIGEDLTSALEARA